MGLLKLVVLTTLLTLVSTSPTSIERRDTFVTNISECPLLATRAAAEKNVHNLRPDEIEVCMAIGDSITAAALAKGIIPVDPIRTLDEARGVSYPIGSDPGALTLPNIIKRYNAGVQGASIGRHPVEGCVGLLCAPLNPTLDKLNAALSGSTVDNLEHAVRDYLIPQVLRMNIPASTFKYLNLQIGSNDICQRCLGANADITADVFAEKIKATLEMVRLNIPNTIVNVLGVIRVSEIYDLTLNQTYCPESRILPLPHVNFECPCALLPGAVGDATRAEMDSLRDQFDARLLRIVQDYQVAHYPDFAVTWQPLNLSLASFPIQAVSNVDCFHPSEALHARVAAQLWNKLPLDAVGRATAITYPAVPQIRCAQAEDRILTSAAIGL